MTTLATAIGRGTNAARPAAGFPGRLWYDTTNSQLTRDNGTTWDVVEGAGGMTNPMTTAGDIITGGAAGAAQRLAVGSASQVLTVVSGAPAWATPGGGALTQAYLGYNTIGASAVSVTSSRQYMKKITISTACFLSSIDLHMSGNAANVFNLQPAVADDNAATIGNILATANGVGGTAIFLSSTYRWFSLPVGIYLAAADYWIGFVSAGSGAVSIHYDGSGTDRYMDTGGWISDGDRYAQTATTNQFSIRANTFR